MTPHERSQEWLAEHGYVFETVEHHRRHSLTTGDLFGCLDLLALRGLQTLGVQTTSAENVSHRLTKMRETPFLSAMEAAGWRVVVHGWRKDGRLREVVVLEGRPSWDQLQLDLGDHDQLDQDQLDQDLAVEAARARSMALHPHARSRS